MLKIADESISPVPPTESILLPSEVIPPVLSTINFLLPDVSNNANSPVLSIVTLLIPAVKKVRVSSSSPALLSV